MHVSPSSFLLRLSPQPFKHVWLLQPPGLLPQQGLVLGARAAALQDSAFLREPPHHAQQEQKAVTQSLSAGTCLTELPDCAARRG